MECALVARWVVSCQRLKRPDSAGLECAIASLVYTLEGHGAPVWALAWSPDGSQIASVAAALGEGSSGVVNRVERDDGTVINTLGFELSLWSVAWSPDGTLLAAGGNDGNVRLINASTGESVGSHRRSSIPGVGRSLAQ